MSLQEAKQDINTVCENQDLCFKLINKLKKLRARSTQFLVFKKHAGKLASKFSTMIHSGCEITYEKFKNHSEMKNLKNGVEKKTPEVHIVFHTFNENSSKNLSL